MSVRVVLVEDQPVVRAGFKALLDAQPDIEVVGEAASGSQALIVTREQRPDVVVMDIRMPDMDGMEATRWIRADSALEPTRVLVLTTFELDEYVLGALQASASGFLLKRGRAERPAASGEDHRRWGVAARPKCHPAAHRPVPDRPGDARAHSPRGLRRVDQPRAGDAHGDRARHDERGDRPGLPSQSPHRQGAHLPHPDEARGARPRPLVVIAYESGLVTR